jgi:hypothetical protein
MIVMNALEGKNQIEKKEEKHETVPLYQKERRERKENESSELNMLLKISFAMPTGIHTLPPTRKN